MYARARAHVRVCRVSLHIQRGSHARTHTITQHRFCEDTIYEVDMEELATVCTLLVDEVDRLRTADDSESNLAGRGRRSLGGGGGGISALLEEGSHSSFWKRRRLPPYDTGVSGGKIFGGATLCW